MDHYFVLSRYVIWLAGFPFLLASRVVCSLGGERCSRWCQTGGSKCKSEWKETPGFSVLRLMTWPHITGGCAPLALLQFLRSSLQRWAEKQMKG